MKTKLILAALCLTPFAASAANIQISDLLQNGTLCFGSGTLCETGATLSATDGGNFAYNSGWLIQLGLTLTGSPLSGVGSGTVISSDWDGSSLGTFTAQLHLGVSGANFFLLSPDGQDSPGAIQVSDAGGGGFRIASSFSVYTVLADFDLQDLPPFTGADEAGGTLFQSADFVPTPEPASLLLLCGPAIIGYCIRKRRMSLQ